MYRRILVALENGPADQTLVPHIGDLARRLGSELLLVHVADGWELECEVRQVFEPEFGGAR